MIDDVLDDDAELLEDDAREVGGDAPRDARARPRRANLRQRSEARIQRGCQDVIVVEWEGYAIKHHGSSHSVAGTPDIIACLDGRMVVIEVKRPGQRPTAPQIAQMRRWQDAGALAGWVTSEDETRDLLRRVGDHGWRNDFTTPGGKIAT